MDDDFPVKTKKRARRRFHKFRIRNKISKWFSKTKYFYDDLGYGSWKKELLKMADNPQKCSCIRCKNPRQSYNEKTLQEVKADMNMKEQLNDSTNNEIGV